MKKINLNGVWDLPGKAVLPDDSEIISIKCKVPGAAQLDLAESGYLPKDLFMGENIRETEKFEDYDWCMREPLRLGYNASCPDNRLMVSIDVIPSVMIRLLHLLMM